MRIINDPIALTRMLTVCGLVSLASSCAGLSDSMKQSLAIVTPKTVDFVELEHYAVRAKAAYGTPDEIRRQFPDTTRVTTVEPIEVQYFLETDDEQKTQTITIRGTQNKKNIWQDASVFLIKDDRLGFRLHRGFRDTSLKVYEDLKPHLNDDYDMRVTGHSLGGAIALILTNYMYRDGYRMERLVTFGQPKVTDDKSDTQYRRDNPDIDRITRVVHEDDPIALVPPVGLAVRYGHVGPEVILRQGPDYVYISTHQADRLSIGEFWRNFGHNEPKAHFMVGYLANIRGKIENGNRQVPFKGS